VKQKGKSPGRAIGILIGSTLGAFVALFLFGILFRQIGPGFASFIGILTVFFCAWLGGKKGEGNFFGKSLQGGYDGETNVNVGSTERLGAPCARCRKDNVRLWSGQYRCWDCGYVLSAAQVQNQLATEKESHEGDAVSVRYLDFNRNEQSTWIDPESVRLEGTKVNMCLASSKTKLIVERERILNPEVLPLPDLQTEVLPPILEPKEIFIGDVSGKELIYTRQDGRRGIIYFEPGTAEVIDNALYLQARALLSPKGRPERYSILMESVINPEILFETDEPQPPPEPEPVTASFETGTRVVLNEVPLDSYEAVKVMRRLQPTLSPFEIFEELRNDQSPVLQGLEEYRAKDLQEDFQAAGCRVTLQVIDKAGDQPVVAEPPPIIETKTLRPPTEEEFHEIRFGIDGERINPLITSGELNLNVRDRNGQPLIHGCMNPHIVDLLIDHGANPCATDTQGNTAMHNTFESTVIVKLIDRGLSPNTTNSAGQTAMHLWAAQGQPEPVHALLTAGTDPAFQDRAGQTALDLANAATFNSEEELQNLHQVIALLEEHLPQEPELPPVIEEELPPVIKRPEPHAGRIPTSDEFFKIQYASDYDFVATAKLIRSGELNLNAKDKYGNPLIFGVQNEKVLDLLVEYGANVHVVDKYEQNALHHCADGNEAPEVCLRLIQLGVDINAKDHVDATPLIVAAEYGNFEIAKILIENGADIHHQPEYGKSALESAENHIWDGDQEHECESRENCKKIAQLLREHGAE